MLNPKIEFTTPGGRGNKRGGGRREGRGALGAGIAWQNLTNF